jgi:hypothetical protein
MSDFPQTLGDAFEDVCRHLDEDWAALIPILEKILRHDTAARALAGALRKPALMGEASVPPVRPYLLDRGWYVTCHFPLALTATLDALVRAGEHEAVNRLMSDLARERLPEVEKALRARFPNRERFFADAFQAHRQGKYTLSIPVFLAQADGVGCEVLGVPRQFFRAKNRSLAVDKRLPPAAPPGQLSTLDCVKHALLSPLREESSLGAATEERDARRVSEPGFGPLNRHGVQHGLDLDYPTEENSLRCITLLDYLLDVDRLMQREEAEEVAERRRTWQHLLLRLEQAHSLNATA